MKKPILVDEVAVNYDGLPESHRETVRMYMTIRDGDVFRWSYSSDKLNSNYLSYWAKSRICEAKGGVLRDTYWGSATDGSVWQYSEVGPHITLEFIANYDELEKISDGEADYYDEADIVNLNHGNDPKGNVYRRKGTSRSRSAMLAKLDRAVERAESEIRSSHLSLELLAETRRNIEAGMPLERMWI